MGKGSRDDRLSALPDDILVNILDRLNVPEAARTSILARRWGQLCAKLSRLIISVQDFLPEGVLHTNVSVEELVRTNAAVVQATESILARRNPGEHTIRLLSTTFYLRDDAPLSIGRAVGHVMATHLVEVAKFTVRTGKDDIAEIDDDELITCARKFMVFFDACSNAFGGLTSLDLENLRFGESDISSILVSCKQLKHLHLYNCDCGEHSTLQVDHAHLSELCIVQCLLSHVKLSWLPQLTQLVFDGWIDYDDPLFIGHVPLLKAVSLTNVALSSNKMFKLSEFLSSTSVQNLKLGFKSEKVCQDCRFVSRGFTSSPLISSCVFSLQIWVQPECPTQSLASVFRQLRFVNLVNIPEGYDLTWTMFILEAAPLLKDLYITVWDHACSMEMDEEKRKKELYSEDKGVEWDEAAADFQHRSLVTLVICGFESEDCFVNYVRRVMTAAVNLEDVFLYSRLDCDNCKDEKKIRFPWTKRQRISLKKRITVGIESFAIIHSSKMVRDDHQAKILYPECSR
uniref:F-box domain-containing protein n=1 Tax=Aegilops tauschii subsp. strangulata TaxID=200361 RepID=A0A453Q4X2_AEGTS